MARRALIALGCGVLVHLLGSTAPHAQDPGSNIFIRTDDVPVFRTATTVVQFDAFVTDAEGNPVQGLTAADFELVEAGRTRDIVSLVEARLPIPRARDLPNEREIEPDVATNARPPGRTFVFAFDEIGPDRALRMRHVLRDFMAGRFGPDDQGAVALLGRGLADSGQDFTSNRRLLLQAIDKVSGGFPNVGSSISPTLTEMRAVELSDACPKSSPDVRQLAASLRKLSEFLATLPGRKVLILVAEGLTGLDFNLLRSYRGGVLSMQGTDAHAALAALTRGNVTVYPLDPCGLGGFNVNAKEQMEAHADLKALADVTGGFAITNTNNYPDAFDRLVRDNSTFYTIGFESGYEKADGRFVRVNVRVKRPGVQVRAREGYLAPIGEERRPQAVKGDTRLATVARGLASAVSTGGVDLTVVATPYRSAREAHVAVVIEMAAPAAGLTRKGDVMTAPIEVSYLATDSRGKVKPGKRHTATLTVPASRDASLPPERLRVWSDFQLSPGRYQLRSAGGTRAVAGSVISDLEVPDFIRSPLALSGLFVIADQAPAPKTVALSSPLADVLPGTPTTRRDFARSETVMVFGEAYDNRTAPPGSEPVVISASLRGDTGAVHPVVPDARVLLNGSSRVHRFVLRLPLAEMSPGAYVLEIRAESGGHDPMNAVRRIPLNIR